MPMTDETIALKPCPFCGKQPILTCTRDEVDGYDIGFTIRCQEQCGIELNDEYRSSVIDAWNIRPAAPAAMPSDAAIVKAISDHTSPTMGQGSIHGGVPGVILYEDHQHFVVAALRKLFGAAAPAAMPGELVEAAKRIVERLENARSDWFPCEADTEEAQEIVAEELLGVAGERGAVVTDEMQRLLTVAREAIGGDKANKAERALESLQDVFDRAGHLVPAQAAEQAVRKAYIPPDGRARPLLAELYALVKGECSSLLDGDRGGDGDLAMAIEDALAASPAPSAEALPGMEEIERLAKVYAEATGYYVEFHRGLSSESADKIRAGIKAVLIAQAHPQPIKGQDDPAGSARDEALSLLQEMSALADRIEADNGAVNPEATTLVPFRFLTAARDALKLAPLSAGAGDLEPFPQPRRKDGGEPCGECHLQPGETCDICGAIRPATPTAQGEQAEAKYPEGVRLSHHIAHDMRMGRFPQQSTIAEFLRERAAQGEQAEEVR